MKFACIYSFGVRVVSCCTKVSKRHVKESCIFTDQVPDILLEQACILPNSDLFTV